LLSDQSPSQIAFAEYVRALPGIRVEWLANARGLLDVQHQDWSALVSVDDVATWATVWIDSGYREIDMTAGEAQAVMHALAGDEGRIEVTRSLPIFRTVVLTVPGPSGDLELTRPFKYPLTTWEERRASGDPT
jgi:hypothetical protein